MTKHSRPGEETRQRIIDAAGPIFAARGFRKATVREICAAAGVNIASVGYYFGDKLHLYLHVVRGIRAKCEQAFPMPPLTGTADQQLKLVIETILQRLLTKESVGWEDQLMMREMHEPTEAFRELVEEYFRPQFDCLLIIVQSLVGHKLPAHQFEQLVLSIVGQCVYYRVGNKVVRQLIPEDRYQQHFDTASLAAHITSFSLAALTGMGYRDAISQACSPTQGVNTV